MKPQTQPQQATPAPATATEYDGKKWLDSVLDKQIKYVPFQAESSIELTARQVMRFLCTPTKDGHVCTVDQAVKFLKLCEARKLNPWEGDAFLVGYDTKNGPQFSLITAHQAFLKRAEANPMFDGMASGVLVRQPDGTLFEAEGDYVDDGQTLVGAWATVHRKDRKYPTLRRIKLSAYAKPFGVWNSNAAGMIVKCAEADALRSTFPNVLGGLYVDGETLAESATETQPEAPRRPTISSLKASASTRPPIQQHTPAPVTQAEPEPEVDPFAGDPVDPVDGGIGGELFGQGENLDALKN